MSSQGKLFGKLSYWMIGVAALGFFYLGGASAARVLHGSDGGSVSGDGKFAFTGTCVDTLTKQRSSSLCSGAPTVGYLYKGPDSAGKFYRTGTCWSRSLGIAVACSTSSGFISSSFSHHGVQIQGGDLTVTLGDIDPSEQLMTVVPGGVGTPAKATVDLPDILVKGSGTSTEACGSAPVPCFLGEGRFSYHVEYTIPLATSDPNRGGGNETCGKCDPNNPKKGASCTGCSINQTCTNLSTTESQFTVKAFCQQGVIVTGKMVLLPTVNGSPQPAPPFTNCDAARVAAGTCALELGGLPLTNNGTVDGTACAQIFDLVNVGGDTNKQLAQKQLLLFQQNYQGQCTSATLGDFGLESPDSGTKKGLHRECNSDYGDNNFVAFNENFLDGQGLDNTVRGCVVGTNDDGSPAFHVAQGGETAKTIEVTVDVTPESVNLRCVVGSDSGIATATICTTPEFNVTNVDIAALPVLFVEGDTSCSGGPCIVPAIPGGFSFAASSSGLCSGDFSQDMRITYRTCSVNLNGLAQVIRNWKPDITAGTKVPLRLHGTIGNGSVVIEGADTITGINP